MDERRRTEQLAHDHERRLAADDREGRRAQGAFYTPPELVEWVLDRALDQATARVLDPACGAGHFLVAAARRLGVRAVHGSDLDAEAVRIARLRLAAEDPSVPPADIERQVRVADGLTAWEGDTFDAVVGNPPFLGRLRRRTATAGPGTHGLGAYTDASAVFLHHALDLVRPTGTVALVQPLSVLAARDATRVREAVAERGAVTEMWVSEQPVFAGTTVRTCVPVVRLGAAGGPGPDDWGRLAAPYFGIPPVDLAESAGAHAPARRSDGAQMSRLGELATCTADFRDQYYGLVPFVREATDADGGAPLVTSGLIEPASCEWGRRPTRFARQEYAAPVVDVAALAAADPRLGAWARSRLVPKILVAGQGRVIEAVADERGMWLPSVPVVSVLPNDPDDLWRLLAVLLAPPVVAHAAARYLGTGLSPGSVKVSASQLAALPLPMDAAAWDEGAELARRGEVARLGAVMTTAYGVDPVTDVLDWWLTRVARRPARR